MTTECIVADWNYIHKKYITTEDIEKLTINVTFPNGNYESFYFYSIEGDYYVLPRYFYFKNILKIPKENISITQTKGIPIKLNMKENFKPRNKYQEQAIDAIINNNHGVIEAKTAFGKTYVAIDSTCRLKKKALILVHKEALITQWKNEFLKYTDIKEDEISILSGKKYNISDKIKVYISTVQNFSSKIKNNNFITFRNELYMQNIGITFLDECHTTAAPHVFMQGTRWCFSERIYGLSATPNRGDDFDNALKWILGDVIFKDTRIQMPVYYSLCPFVSKMNDNTYKALTYAGRAYALKYQKWLLEQFSYLGYCDSFLKKLIECNRKILVICNYKDLLETVFHNLEHNKKILVHGTTVKYETKYNKDGTKSKKKKRVKIDHTFLDYNKHDIVFSTLKFFDAGLSIEWFDTLIFLTPPPVKSEVALPQVVGRLLREFENKNYVYVFDLYNTEVDIERFRMFKRIKRYDDLKYINMGEINDINLIHSKINELEKAYSD